jgi:hypothetical protein
VAAVYRTGFKLSSRIVDGAIGGVGMMTLLGAAIVGTSIVRSVGAGASPQTAAAPGVPGFHERHHRRLRQGKRKFHVILDNLNTHKPKNDRWLKTHPNVHLHFTPTHTSWLNQIECWFSILSRQALQGASFVDVKQLREAIDHFISAYNELRSLRVAPN